MNASFPIPPAYLPPQSEGGESRSAAVEDVVTEVLHLEDRGIGATGGRLAQVRVDDFAHHDVVIAFLDNRLHLALQGADRGIEDRLRRGGPAHEGLAREHAILQLCRLEEGESQV